MKKAITLVFACMLSGCVHPLDDYQPKFSSPPKNEARYEFDRKFCISDARERHKNATGITGDALITPREMVDQCMAQKGYDVVKIDRPFGISYGNNEKVFP